MTITLFPHARKQKKKHVSLEDVKIRLVRENEQQRWNEQIVKHHYLKNANLSGRQLCYVVEFKRKCLGLLSFSAPALMLKGRDEWIGWDYATRQKRIDFIIQNSRFLIFPWITTKNLASKILSLARKAVVKDWQEKYGYAPLIIETFVDRSFHGTSYRADNWTRLGETAGYSRDSKNFYIQNNAPKSLWCVELEDQARTLLCAQELPDHLKSFERTTAPTLTGSGVKDVHLNSLFDALNSVPDPRGSKGRRHNIGSCLGLIVCGMMAGCKSMEECATFGKTLKESQKASLGMYIAPGQTGNKRKRTSPSHSAICDLLNKIDPLEFEAALARWQQKVENTLPVAIAIDGKTVRATLQKNEEGKEDCGLHVVSAVPHEGDSLFFSKPPLNSKDTNAKQPLT